MNTALDTASAITFEWVSVIPLSSYLLVEVHVLHLGFEQLHFVHGYGVLKALLCSCRTLSILLLLLLSVHIVHRATAGKHDRQRNTLPVSDL